MTNINDIYIEFEFCVLWDDGNEYPASYIQEGMYIDFKPGQKYTYNEMYQHANKLIYKYLNEPGAKGIQIFNKINGEYNTVFFCNWENETVHSVVIG